FCDLRYLHSFPTRRSSDLGEDVLYAFTPPTSGLITISITSSSSLVGLFLYQDCPTVGTCVANSASSSGNQTLSNIFVTAGLTYRSEEHTSELQSRENLVCR